MNLNPESRLVLPVGARDHLRGSATASVTLLEYGDYECPHCGQAYVVVEDPHGPAPQTRQPHTVHWPTNCRGRDHFTAFSFVISLLSHLCSAFTSSASTMKNIVCWPLAP